MYKLGYLQDDTFVEHTYQAVYQLPAPPDPTGALIAGVPHGDPMVFLRLTTALTPPYFLLYVLHTPRGVGEPGRYQSPPLDRAEVQAFVADFARYLSKDARFDLWSHSPAENATVVWDRHNQLFAYGPLDRFEAELRSLGFTPGDPAVPVPHQHNYHHTLDPEAARLLQAFDWHHTPLRPADEQIAPGAVPGATIPDSPAN
jgi:hypothetical protein